jgi:hypothetical protein
MLVRYIKMCYRFIYIYIYQNVLPVHIYLHISNCVTSSYTFTCIKMRYQFIYIYMYQTVLPVHIHLHISNCVSSSYTFTYIKLFYQFIYIYKHGFSEFILFLVLLWNSVLFSVTKSWYISSYFYQGFDSVKWSQRGGIAQSTFTVWPNMDQNESDFHQW